MKHELIDLFQRYISIGHRDLQLETKINNELNYLITHKTAKGKEHGNV